MGLLSSLITGDSTNIESEFLRILPNPVIAVDNDMNIIYVNEAAAGMTGKSATNCLGQKCYALFKSGHCNTSRCATHRAMTEKKTVTDRTTVRPGRGTIPIQYSGVPVTNGNGKVVAGVELMTDLTQIYQVVNQVARKTGGLIDTSDQLSSSAKQAGQASRQVADISSDLARVASEQATMLQSSSDSMRMLEQVVEQVSTGSHKQSSEITKAGASVGQVSSVAEQVAVNASSAATGSRDAAKLAEEGASKTRETVEGMNKISVAVDDAVGKVGALGTASEQIGKIVAVIEDIAAQTNLLALNAAIEAARAGEHGRGFAVVSDEVRKLAERTVEATKEIVDLVTNVQTGVTEAVSAMEQGAAEVQSGSVLATESGEFIERILQASQGVSEQINQISAAAEELTASSGELVSVVDNVGSITEENSAASGQMSDNTQEMGRSIESAAGISEQNSAASIQMSSNAQEMGEHVEEIITSSTSLSQMANELRQSVAILAL